MSIKSKMKERRPLQGDYYEGVRDRDAIDPASGLTWGNKYKRDLERWESRNAESDARERAGMAYCNSLGAHTGAKCPTLLECECIYLENFLKHYDNE